MTPTATLFDATLPPLRAIAGSDGPLLVPASNGAIWASLSEGFARFFPSPARAADVGECAMDSPSL